MMEFGQYRTLEFSAPADFRNVQESLLREHAAYALEHSPFYRRVLRAAGVDPRALTLDGLAALPFTDKSHLEEQNDDFLAVPPNRIVDIVLSSGTTGKPTRVMYTRRDLDRLAYNERLSFEGCGVTADDVALLTCTLDRCFVAGLAYFLGLQSLGAACIRNGHGTMESHLDIIARLKPTMIVGVPSFLRKLGQYLEANGVKASATGVRKLVCIGEPLRDRGLALLPLGRDLEAIWNARAYSTYASSEIVTTFCECTAQCGGHLHPDLAIVEIVDENGRAVPDGDVGEVVVTPFAVEGMPLIRFKTGDMSFLAGGACACGRFSPRLGPIVGRKKQMLKVRGTTLYPQAVFAALDEIPGVKEYYVEVESEDDLSDRLTVHVALDEAVATAARVGDKLQSRLRVKPVIVVEAGETLRSLVHTPKLRKPVRFVDRRKSRS